MRDLAACRASIIRTRPDPCGYIIGRSSVFGGWRMRMPSLRPTPEGAATLALSGFLFLLATNLMAGWLFFLAAFLVAVLVVGAATSLGGTRAVRVEEEAASPAVEEGTVTLLLQVRAHRVARFVRVAAEAGGRRGEAFLPAVRPGAQRILIRLPAPSRGVYPLKLRVISLGLVGMFRAERELPGRVEVVVRPRYRALDRLPVGVSTDGGPREPQRRRGEELFGIREYRPGDPARHIHWRSSARHRRLLVKEFAAPQAPELAVVVDTQRGQAVADLDAAARAAASIAWTALQRGWRVSLLWCGQNGPAAVSGPWEQIWDALARLRAEGPTLAQALAQLTPRLRGGVPVVVSGLPVAARGLPPTAPVVMVASAGSAAGWEFDRGGGVRCAC